jgi:stage V sporulation protein R
MSNLKTIQEEIKAYAKNYGLDFFEVIFEILNFNEMNFVASYGGFPTRYPHWSFGMEYEKIQKTYAYGLTKIYEMVINNDPCYAYLLECNTTVDQKLVTAHVYAHCDFFKNNYYFSKTNRKMLDEMANHATRVRKYIEKYGLEKVENFLDTCLSIDNLIDYHLPFISRTKKDENNDIEITELRLKSKVKKLRSKDYMDSFINPTEYLEAQKNKLLEQLKKKKNFPEEPTKDIMEFLIEFAPLEPWQRDILSIIREESYYFAPQGQTKIMNEGWATYWHSKIMTEKALKPSELIDYADHHSGTLASHPGIINPYKIGVELFRDIEDRYNKGKFGKEYQECSDYETKKRWDKKLNQGRQKIFEVRKLYNDVMFIDEFLTEEFCREHKFFIYDYNPKTGYYEISSREFKKVKERFLFSLTNFGQPHIYVEDANFENRSELYLMHKHEGMDLKIDEARETLKLVYNIWKRPVNLETIKEDKKTLLVFDGNDHKEIEMA